MFSSYRIHPAICACPVSRTLFNIYCYIPYECLRVSIADSCTFHRNLTCRNATNHCPRASFSLIHGSRGLQRHYSPLKDIVCKLRYIVANALWRNDQTISISIKYASLSYRTGDNRKRPEQSMTAGHRSALETVFSIVICRKSGDKWQSKALFLAILDPRSSIALTFSIASYLDVF